ncbi:MAG: tetratricopeptide repeat protein [Methylophilus sp.]|jgi:predicted O-linked N-acetylglucosamine transferase (SPINDLY family)
MSSISQLKSAIQQNPNDAGLYYDLGALYLAALQIDAAMASYTQALKLAPNHPQILLQLGNTASAANRYELAATYFKQCLQAEANNPAAFYNLANTYRAQGKLTEAVTCFLQTLELTPKDANAHNNLGNVYRELGELDKAISCYKLALQCNPQLHHALAHLIHQKQHICDWQGLNKEIALLRNIVKTDAQAQIAPFAFLAMPNTTAQEQLQCASQWATQQYSALSTLKSQLNFSYPRQSHHKIKIAYLSADFRLHPLAYLISELLENHDRTQFEVYAYSYGIDDATAARQRIIDAVDSFVDIQKMSDVEAANHIKQQQIDILVALTGYTKSSRTGIVALKPAPISINCLGYPGTMGMLNTQSLFDYIIVDNVIAPESRVFSEQCINLPCYQPNNSNRPIGHAGLKSEHHLPDDTFVFCCFNQTFKISAEVFAAWMRLLAQVPNSVLWLLDCNQWAKQNLMSQAKLAGISVERIVFAARTSIADHIARHQHADLFLDTLPYNAHTTASDALWMDLPIVTQIGNTFSARVAASLLKTIGLDELVVNSSEAYEQLALSLALDKNKLLALRQKISLHKNKLFDNQGYVKILESKYNKIYTDYKISAI